MCGKVVHAVERPSRQTSIAVSDIEKAVALCEGRLGLEPLAPGPSTKIVDGSRVYGSVGRPALNVYQSVHAGKTGVTFATWYVDAIDEIVEELAAAGVEFYRVPKFRRSASTSSGTPTAVGSSQ
jgi:catechol 2,3-dioxygenase-like lactoylglutathione lyase family enzyme